MEQYERNWKNYYEILQVSPKAEPTVITAAYRRLAQSYHPDTAKARIEQLKAQIAYHKHRYYVLDSPEISDTEYDKLVRELKELQRLVVSARMADINEAYEILSDPTRRSAYDSVFRTKYPPQEAKSEAPTEEEILAKINWFQRHLNWTWVFAYLIWMPLNASRDVEPQIIGNIFLLVVSGWVIKQKGRRLWWLLLSWVFSPLWLKNKKGFRELTETKDPKARFIQKARTGTGCFVQIIGGLLWLGCGLYILFYEIRVIFDAFGFWLAALAFMLFPIVYVFAFFIDWFITGIFPLGIFILWLLSLAGSVIAYAGSRIRGEEL